MKLKTTVFAALAAAFGFALMAGSAQAATIAQLIAANPNFQLEDDSAENQNVDLNTNGLLDVGDTLRGIVEFPQLRNLDTTDVTLLTPLVGNTNLSAVFEIVVTSKTQTAGAGTPLDPSDDLFTFTFGAYAPFAVELGLETGAMIAFYEDAVDNVSIGGAGCTTVGSGGDCEGNVIDGTLVLQLGESATELDEAWVASNATDNTSALTGVSPSTAVGNFQFQLDVLDSAIGEFGETQDTFIDGLPGGNNLIAWLGSGSVLGTEGLNTPYDVSDDADLQATAVPEPTTLGLMGAGLLALAGFARRRFRKAA
jgi:hypothetical protein